MGKEVFKNNLTHGEETLINLVEAIKAKSQSDHLEGLPENKRLNEWGAALVNSEEYIIAKQKLEADQKSVEYVADEVG